MFKTQICSKIVILALLAVVSTFADECQTTRTIRENGLNIRKIDLNIDNTFTWQATRGTLDIIIQYGDGINLTASSQADRTLMVNGNAGSKGNVSSPSPSLMTSLALSVLVCFLGDKRAILLLSMALVCLFAMGLADTPDCDDSTMIHILIPSTLVEEICQKGQCRPVICKLNPSSDYSNLPSNNKLVFADEVCTVRQPAGWQQWLDSYFGPNSTQDYYGDYDSDGLVNVLEYYGQAAFNNTFLVMSDPIENGTVSRTKRAAFDNLFTSSDPTKADSDGDLLQDGFEAAHSLNPVATDNANGDPDKDGLNNLMEQILHTDPSNPDSDGDGISDGQETADGGNPSNPADKGRKPPDVQDARIKLTVGDHSGSHSERYILHVGRISHQSPGFGLVGSGTYTFKPGTYAITLQHSGSIRSKPDYDYTARLSKTSGKAKVTIEDPQGILGVHHESSYFYAAGKSATLVVEDECSEDGEIDQECKCAKLKTCVTCKANDKCAWDVDGRTCAEKGFWNSLWQFVFGTDKCPCEKCQDWYIEEKMDTRWLDELNRLFPCPCRVSIGKFSLTPIGQPAADWGTDWACMANGLPLCAKFHPGATGCLRSANNSAAGARQQCCYGDDGNVLPTSHAGAGTPDRSGSFREHQRVDVKPFNWCCKECEEPASCQRYMEVRGGDNTHCNQ